MNIENRPKTVGKALGAVLAFVFCLSVQASWYWPFGSDPKDEKKDQPRLSELMEGASLAIDNASDLAAEGKVEEAVAEYRKALAELDRVERENPERAATPEFATVRNKRAIVNASIDSLYLAQARENARAVAVTDTTELEKRYAERCAERKAAANGERKDESPKLESQLETYMEEERGRTKAIEEEAERIKTERTINELLEDDPTSCKALNMRAVYEAEHGDTKAAAKTLKQAIKAHPNDYHAYYNMANLIMQTTGKKSSAKRYYSTGRKLGGPEDKDLEAMFK